MEVYTDISLNELSNLPIGKRDSLQLQFTTPPTVGYCETLNKVLLENPNIRIRFYSYEGRFRDLNFLNSLSNINKLILQDEQIDQLEAIKYLTELEYFAIAKTRNKNLDFRSLIGLKNLHGIEVDGQNGILELISNSAILKELYLAGIGIGDLNDLSHLNGLERLDITKCDCYNYSVLVHFLKLRYLVLVKQPLDELGFISSLFNLEYLRLESLNIIDLPDLTNCQKLQRILLSNLSKLKSYKNLATARFLIEIGLFNIKTLEIADFEFLQNNNRIKKIVADIKDRKNAKEFNKYLQSIGLN
jgi:hypothetical protein